MPNYVLSKDAAQDLKEIAQYTLEQWGVSAFNKYKKGLADSSCKCAGRVVFESGH